MDTMEALQKELAEKQAQLEQVNAEAMRIKSIETKANHIAEDLGNIQDSHESDELLQSL